MKTDENLGKKVQIMLSEAFLETPMLPTSTNTEEKIINISNYMTNILQELGLNLNDDSLIDTPNRVAKMWVNELFKGLDYSNFPKITLIDNYMNYDEMIVVKNITAHSTCEHHIITIDQNVNIAYIPTNKVIGLSKFSRLAKFFAQRPIVQERYTAQLFTTIGYLLDTEDVAVSVKGKHYCMISRGVEDSNAITITNKFGGAFKYNSSTRNEFLNAINN